MEINRGVSSQFDYRIITRFCLWGLQLFCRDYAAIKPLIILSACNHKHEIVLGQHQVLYLSNQCL